VLKSGPNAGCMLPAVLASLDVLETSVAALRSGTLSGGRAPRQDKGGYFAATARSVAVAAA
jgi:hypothetical protein